MSRLNFHHLRYFQAIARTGNLTRAAETLNISPSALSVQLRQLEAQLGHDLFERCGKRLVLTEAGRIALDGADAIFAAGDELVSTLRGRRGARGVIRIGALATLSRNFQIQFIKPLLGRRDVEVVLRSGGLGDLLASLEAHRIDVLLANLSPPRDAATAWISQPIADQPVSLVGHRDRCRRKRSLREILRKEPLILPTPESSIRIGFDALMQRYGISPQIVAEVDDMAMLRLIARENAGMAVVPPIVVQGELNEGLLVEVERLPELKETFFAITLARRFPNPFLKALLGTETAASETP
ncbi:LysR family transcriptional regulator [Rhodopseudomonas pseudopalustris]|uniref:LysR family transcriptional regulator n=1 Tax=Rhodopseudomonas pseudopalustris TaxID=1513892 RepID=UPI003F943707